MTKKKIDREEELALRRSKKGGVKLKADEMDARKAVIVMKRALESGKVIPGVKFTKDGVHGGKESELTKEWRENMKKKGRKFDKNGRLLNKKGGYDRKNRSTGSGGKYISIATDWFRYKKKTDLHVSVHFYYNTNTIFSGDKIAATTKKKWPMYRIYVNGSNSWGQSNYAPVPKEFDAKALAKRIVETIDHAIERTALQNQNRKNFERLNRMGENASIARLEELAAKGGAKNPKKAALEFGAVIKSVFAPVKAPTIMERLHKFTTPLSQDKIFSLIRAMAKNETLKKARKLSSASRFDSVQIAARTNILFMIAASEAGFLPAMKLHMMLRYLKKINKALDLKPVWTSIKGDIRIPTNSKLHPLAGHFGMDARQFQRFFGAKPKTKKPTKAQKEALSKGREKLAAMPPEAKQRKPKPAAVRPGVMPPGVPKGQAVLLNGTKGGIDEVNEWAFQNGWTAKKLPKPDPKARWYGKGDVELYVGPGIPQSKGKYMAQIRDSGTLPETVYAETPMEALHKAINPSEKPIHPAAEPKDGSMSPVRNKNPNPTTNRTPIAEKKPAKEREAVVPSPMQAPPPPDNKVFESENTPAYKDDVKTQTDAAKKFLIAGGWKPVNTGVAGEHGFMMEDPTTKFQDVIDLSFHRTGKHGDLAWNVYLSFTRDAEGATLEGTDFDGATLSVALAQAIRLVNKRCGLSLDAVMPGAEDEDAEWEAKKEKIYSDPNARPVGDMESDAFDEGAQAAREGLSKEDNPYGNKILAEAWDEGFDSATVPDDGDGVAETAASKPATWKDVVAYLKSKGFKWNATAESFVKNTKEKSGSVTLHIRVRQGNGMWMAHGLHSPADAVKSWDKGADCFYSDPDMKAAVDKVMKKITSMRATASVQLSASDRMKKIIETAKRKNRRDNEYGRMVASLRRKLAAVGVKINNDKVDYVLNGATPLSTFAKGDTLKKAEDILKEFEKKYRKLSHSQADRSEARRSKQYCTKKGQKHVMKTELYPDGSGGVRKCTKCPYKYGVGEH